MKSVEEDKKLQSEAQAIEQKIGLRKFGSCPICDDHLVSDGSCCYCDFKPDWTPEYTAEVYNGYWARGHVKEGYERPPKTADDFRDCRTNPAHN